MGEGKVNQRANHQKATYSFFSREMDVAAGLSTSICLSLSNNKSIFLTHLLCSLDSIPYLFPTSYSSIVLFLLVEVGDVVGPF